LTQLQDPSALPLTRPRARIVVAALASALTVLVVLLVQPHSLLQFVNYFVVWNAIIFVFNRDDIEDFSFAFLVNSSFIAVFVLVQATVYPDTYGTTSPLSSSWTDDSYFFALAADTIPPNLPVRENFFLYSHPYSQLIRWLSPFSIDHPLDALFFQSGVAAMLTTYSKKFTWQLSGNARLADTVYLFALICPFLMMNGGVILLRDTFAAALFAYSLSCLNAKRYLLAVAAMAIELAVRPGTCLILLPAYAIIYWPETRAFIRRHPLLLTVAASTFLTATLQLAPTAPDLSLRDLNANGVGILGREIIPELTANPDANLLFLSIQELPYIIKLLLNAAYIFLYPFFGPRYVIGADYLDLRSITLNLVVPLYAFWLNAWFVAGTLTRLRVAARQRHIVVAIVVSLLLIGTYSLQTRHKTIIYPLYYFIVAVGFTSATPFARRCGYIFSGASLLLQIAMAFR
jgi:hypothetical protein